MLNINSIEVSTNNMTLYARKFIKGLTSDYDISITVNGETKNLTLSLIQIEAIVDFLERIGKPLC